MSLLIKHQSFYHVETSQLICRTNQLTDFNLMATLSFNELNLPESSVLKIFMAIIWSTPESVWAVKIHKLNTLLDSRTAVI